MVAVCNAWSWRTTKRVRRVCWVLRSLPAGWSSLGVVAHQEPRQRRREGEEQEEEEEEGGEEQAMGSLCGGSSSAALAL